MSSTLASPYNDVIMRTSGASAVSPFPRKPEEICIFISSTFKDLQPEREVLAKRVFPPFRAMCRERGIEVVDIDLRWGVTEEESSMGKTIRSCLEEIDRCRPFFIGILGDRYGWVPPLREVQKDARLLTQYPWVEEFVLDGRSILEMEFAYGALRDPENAHGAFFYLKEERSDGTLEAPALLGLPHEPPDHKIRLAELRENVLRSGCAVREFSSTAQFEEAVREDLRRFVDTHWPMPPSTGFLDEEHKLHEAYSVARRRAYIINQQTLNRLRLHIQEDTPPLVVKAGSGFGKSSLLAYFSGYLKRTRSETFVISHFIGASSYGSTEAGILRRLIEEIKIRYGIDQSVPEDLESLRAQLPVWLARIKEERIVILIDGLNHLDPSAGELAWLPKHLSANVRLIVSVKPGPSEDFVNSLGWQTLELEPLDEQNRETLAVRYLGEHHKALSRGQLQRIASDRKCSHPLFLKTLLEELRLLGSYRLITDRIERYLSSADLNELLQKVLDRLELDYGERLVREVFSHIWASRFGLSEQELVQLVGVTENDLITFLSALEYHFILRNGRIAIGSDYLFEAVQRRYLGEQQSRRTYHERLAEMYSFRRDERNAAIEEPWQWKSAGNRDKLLASLSDRRIFSVLMARETRSELFGYWNWLADGGSAAELSQPHYREMMREIQVEENPLETQQELAEKIFEFYKLWSAFDIAESFGTMAVELSRIVYGVNSARAAHALSSLGEVYAHIGRFDAARTAQEDSLLALVNAPDTSAAEEAGVLERLSILHYHLRSFEEAEKSARLALEKQRQISGGVSLGVSDCLVNLGAILHARAQSDEQLTNESWESLEIALEMRSSLLGAEDPSMAEALNNLGVFHERDGHAKEATGYFERALGINRKTYGDKHQLTAYNLINLGVSYAKSGELRKGMESLKEALAIRRELFGDDNPSVAAAYAWIGLLEGIESNLEAAERDLRAAMEIREAAYGRAQLSMFFPSTIDLAVVLTRRGNTDLGRELYTEAVEQLRTENKMDAKARSSIERFEKLELTLD